VKRRLLDLAGVAVLLTIVLVVLLVLHALSRELTLHLYLLCLTALVLAAALGALPPRGRSVFDAALRRPEPLSQRPPQLERVERATMLGVANASDLHSRLRPLLREAAAARLAAGRGVELDSPAGRAALGEEAWELLRPDREPPDDRFARGVDEALLRRVVAILETL
jgi:hypothetical protein